MSLEELAEFFVSLVSVDKLGEQKRELVSFWILCHFFLFFFSHFHRSLFDLLSNLNFETLGTEIGECKNRWKKNCGIVEFHLRY